MCTGWGLPGDCLGLGGAGGIFGPAVPIFRVPCCSDDVLFGLANVPEPILGVPGVTVPILGVPAPEILLSVEEGLAESLWVAAMDLRLHSRQHEWVEVEVVESFHR